MSSASVASGFAIGMLIMYVTSIFQFNQIGSGCIVMTAS